MNDQMTNAGGERDGGSWHEDMLTDLALAGLSERTQEAYLHAGWHSQNGCVPQAQDAAPSACGKN